MSSTTSPTDSPVILPMHNPAQAAVVQQPLAPVGNTTHGLFQVPGQATKAMLAKRLAAKGGNPKYISPTDKMMTPCTAKITQSKKKHFNKGKPIQLFSAVEAEADPEPAEDSEPIIPKDIPEQAAEVTAPAFDGMVADDENPF
ncbi:hypothetical protein BU17DRAFT_80362 [Hysterangium stoloniferum]|nr:hypothetical protein BU17DRAFT_80362 [Hysterangium stoloniferum]